MTAARRDNRRRGAATVEFAMVVIPVLMFLFGIFEFGRLAMVTQLMNNAAREGTRYAIVRTFDPDVEANTEAVVREKLAGVDRSLESPAAVNVFAADASGNPLTPDDSPQNAPFGTYIAVSVEGEFRVIVPGLLGLPNRIPLREVALMSSEAN